MLDRETEKRLAVAARSIRHELPLLWANLRRFPLILGNFRWLMKDRYLFGRPKSELSPFLFWKDHLIIVLKTLYTLPLAVFLFGAIIISLYMFELHMMIPMLFPNILCLPFGICLRFLTWYLGSSDFEMRKDVAVDMRDEGEKEAWYLVNGIIESPAMVVGTAEVLHEWTGRAITPLVNPSHGLGVDLLECVLGRTLNTKDAVVDGIVQELRLQLSKGKKVVILAHSQGGIILASVVKELVNGPLETVRERAELLKQLEIYTFGSAADEFACLEDPDTGEKLPFAEHFGAEDDLVYRIGALTYSGTLKPPPGAKGSYKDPKWNGKVYMLGRDLPCNGHLMKEHLLPAINVGLFASESAFMTKYCQRRPRMPHRFNPRL